MNEPKKPTSRASADSSRVGTEAPSRRGFLALLGVTAVAVAVRLPPEPVRPRSPWAGKTRWIGHC